MKATQSRGFLVFIPMLQKKYKFLKVFRYKPLQCQTEPFRERIPHGNGAVLGQAPVAQLDRAPDYESGGQRFESFRVRHLSY